MVEKLKMRVLVIGRNGMLGSDLTEEFKNFQLYSLNKKQLDITKNSDVIKNFKKIKPNIVINAAAYTDVDGNEVNKKLALKINASAVKNLAIICKKLDIILIHFSTDYVFDGKNKNGYREDSKKYPINYYGYTKSLGEDYVTNIMNNYFIVRTSWLFGKNGKNFVDTIIKKSNEREIKVVKDQIGSPTYTKDLAAAVKVLIQNYNYGVYHITNSGTCTWFDFAKEILRDINSKTKVVPIKSKELKRLAKRPKCSILINTKFKNKLPFWNIALKSYLGDL